MAYHVRDEKILRNALKTGKVIESKITKAILQGPAGAGKTSLKCLLLGQKYNKEESTSLIEDPQIAVGRFNCFR